MQARPQNEDGDDPPDSKATPSDPEIFGLGEIGKKSKAFHFGGWKALTSTNNQVRAMSINKQAFALDSHALMRRLEGHNIPSHQAEAIALAVKEFTDDSLQRSLTLFATKEELKMREMIQCENHSEFRSKIISAKDKHSSEVKLQIEEIKADVENRNTQLRYIHGELLNQMSEMFGIFHEMDIKLKDVSGQVMATKYDVLKYCFGLVISISGVTVAILKAFHFGGWKALTSTNNQVRAMSINKQAFALDSHALMRRLEGHNIPSHQAEAISLAVKEVTDDGLQRSLTLFATKEELKMSEMIQGENHSEFRSKIISAKENHFTSVKHQIEEIRVEDENKKTQLRCQMNEAAMELSLEQQREKQNDRW